MLQVVLSLSLVLGYYWLPPWLCIVHVSFGIYFNLAHSYFKGCPKGQPTSYDLINNLLFVDVLIIAEIG